MNNAGEDKKLDWMYKSANSLVDREEYLLGRSVDKSLEQLNTEEKEKKLGLVPPKNHVEHECIPPSIRDFNKIVQAEQVDISAKLQEDPLVAIKKREEEARRQFLQNPVQLKKLQEALKAQELKKKKKKHKKSKGSDSESELDSKIAKKLKYLKGDSLEIGSNKRQHKSKDNTLDTILMHKFNQLKDKLSQEDLNDILEGNVSNTDDEDEEKLIKRRQQKSSSSEDSDHKQKKFKKKRRRSRSSSSDDSENEKYNKPKYTKQSDKYYFKNKSINKNEEKHRKGKEVTISKKTSKRSGSNDSSNNEKYVKFKYKKQDDKNYRNNGKEKSRKTEHNEDNFKKSRKISRRSSSNDSSSDSSADRSKNKKYDNYKSERRDDKNGYKNNSRERSEEKYRKTKYNEAHRSNDLQKSHSENQIKAVKHKNGSDSDLESKILKKLRMLRDSVKSNARESSSDHENENKKVKNVPTNNTKGNKSRDVASDPPSDNSDNEETQSQKASRYYDSDNEEYMYKPKTFGLVKSDGTKIALNKICPDTNKVEKPKKIETVTKSDRKNVKKLTEEEKDKLRREMLKNAEKRDKERSENLKKYREEDKREERNSSNFDKEFLHKQLRKTTENATVETRIKSKLNYIQRSSKHMDSHFSRRT